MKTPLLSLRLSLILAGLVAPLLPAQVVTFTNNTTLGIHDTNYDGFDLVVTNCTVTVDGPHSFASLLVQPGGVLTHTYAPTGSLENRVHIAAEPHALTGTDSVPLNQTGAAPASVAVTDDQGILTYVLNADYTVGTDTNGFVTIQRAPASAIPDGATVLVDYDLVLAPVASGLRLTIASDVTVEIGGTIQASRRGYGPGQGPGKGNPSGSPLSGSGGGHGGYGGTNSANAVGGMAYGSTETPTDKGSGGGNGWSGGGSGGGGGGAVRLTVGGALRVDGLIAAGGGAATNSRAGGGAGGSIWLSAQSFSGGGSLSASGGAGEPPHGGGGGGGHIAVTCSTNAFTGSLVAHGGAGAQRGGAGTILTQITGQAARLVMDNGGFVGASSRLAVNPSQPDVTSTGGAILLPDSAFAHYPLRSLLITSNAWLVAPTYPTTMSVYISVLGDATVESGGAILADGAGHPSGAGTGFGRTYSTQPNTCGGGGGYGGPGGAGANPTATGGATYGPMSDPYDRGSGGGGVAPLWPGGSGGGAIQVIVTGTLTVNGRISANGGSPAIGGAGGGSGGSVWLTCGSLAGNGSITANGGSGDASVGGGGGGGRIAVNYSFKSFSGTITAHGGRGFNNGGAGTVSLQQAGSGPALVLDNGGQTGPSTPLSQTNLSQLRIGAGVSCYLSSGSTLTLDTLQIETSAWLLATNLNLAVNWDATIAAGGGITADFAGYAAGSGPSAGTYVAQTGYFGGGGGHGGLGGYGANSAARGGSVGYDSVTEPVALGSGGGGTSSSAGAGGGVLRLTVNRTLTLDGRISAEGRPVIGSGAGAGAGGSVWLKVGTLIGTGAVSASGGSADARWGGGGGGRVAVHYTTNLFAGRITARGGAGYNGGGAGTVFLRAWGAQYGTVFLDNNGLSGPPTPFNLSTMVDISLGNGAWLSNSGSIYLRNLVIQSNAWLSVPLPLNVTGDATIQPGGIITADGAGLPAGIGPGAGRYSITNGGGGAHGGYGGAGGYALAFGGVPYDSLTSPAQGGSGGGSASGSTTGGAGGGLIRLSVSGALTVNGRITAAGQSAPGNGGGGAGGGIWLSAGTFSGTGVVAADGGDGHPISGGGGSGGRIAITCTSNLFNGALRAWGGGGMNRGGAGTIYSKGANEPYGLVVLDNGGLAGTNTGLSATGPVDVVMRGGARWLPTSPQTVRNLGVETGAALLLGSASLTASGSATIHAGGSVNADRTGNLGGQGQGSGKTTGYGSTTSGGGGSYGGTGGMGTNSQASAGLPYGNVTDPLDLGSGGGGIAVGSSTAGGAGGGRALLNVTDTLRVDGTLSANGGNATGQGGGGGSGGTVSVAAGSIVGSGTISANGGTGDWPNGGGGGGGRIALDTRRGQATNTFAGTITAWGGNGKNPGGSGTIYILTPLNRPGRVIVDGGDLAGPSTSLTSSGGAFDLWLQRCGSVTVSGTLPLRSLLVGSNCSLVWKPTVWQSAVLTLSGDATLEAGGSIVTDGTGYPAGQGSAAGHTYTAGNLYAGGGGHGGYGAAGGNPQATGGFAIGSITQPVTAGSGGASATTGGAGGGVMQMSISGTLRLDGRVSANGLAAAGPGGGGGAGGSLKLSAKTLAGSGAISANGGNGDAPLGGGGGGGRIAVYCATNDFNGLVTAYGGGGANCGGAGTYFLQCSNQPSAQLVLDNGGWPGADTPFSSLGTHALTVAGGARAVPTVPADFVQSLRVGPGGLLTSVSGQPTVEFAVVGDAIIESGGSVTMDRRGYAQMSGPGAGHSATSLGSGAGYGGEGGATPGAAGGATYGSAETPLDPGSGGGLGWGPQIGGSEGGGAIRLSVGGTLTVDGNLSANGNDGYQDNAGGGSGGSLWIAAGTLAGTGTITADGGWGEFWFGGGGGGGRIADSHREIDFSGTLSVRGGEGAAWGGDGSVCSSYFPPFDLGFSPMPLTVSPGGNLSYSVSSVGVLYDAPISPSSVSVWAFSLYSPTGQVAQTSITAQFLSSRSLQFNFPSQNTPGDYEFCIGPGLAGLFGQPVRVLYFGAFTLVQPLISGVVTNLNGEPVPGVTLQPDGGLPSVVTDTNGAYALPVLPSWTGTVTPSLTGYAFVPGARAYEGVAAAVTGADFLMVETITPALTFGQQGANLLLNWLGVPGVTYDLSWSTNLVDWQISGASLMGTNGSMQILVPVTAEPQKFFRLRAQN
jgi:hypothetical protein